MLKIKYHSVSDCVLTGYRDGYGIERPINHVDHDEMVAAAVEMIEKFDLDEVDVSDAHTGEVYLTVYDEIEDEFDDSVDESFYNPYMGSDCYD
jgi:hypothetical protein